jgi:hypothetical protein
MLHFVCFFRWGQGSDVGASITIKRRSAKGDHLMNKTPGKHAVMRLAVILLWPWFDAVWRSFSSPGKLEFFPQKHPTILIAIPLI